MATLRKYGHEQVVEAAAVVATNVMKRVVTASKKGKASQEAYRDLNRVMMVEEASKYLSADKIKDLLTYLSLL